METGTSKTPASFCLISDSALVNSIVQLGCPAPCEIATYTFEDLVNKQLELSEKGQGIVSAAQTADAVLVAWTLDKAPVINTLGYHLRKTLAGPVIALCNGDPSDAIAALAGGADHAVALPIHLPLLQAMVISYRRLARASQQADQAAGRAVAPQPDASREKVLEAGRLKIDDRAHRFFLDDKEIPLTNREYALLRYLMVHPDEARSRDQILSDVWGINFETGTNMVDVYMYFLRRKLESHGLKNVIETIRGFGYRLSVEK